MMMMMATFQPHVCWPFERVGSSQNFWSRLFHLQSLWFGSAANDAHLLDSTILLLLVLMAQLLFAMRNAKMRKKRAFRE